MMAGRGMGFSAAAGGPARHIPVMLSEVLGLLEPGAGKTFIDGTFGAGGYTAGLLEAAPCNVLAIDRDPGAIQFA
jgi:16S rRNA (cytosine1402-N4)-methyltransferase